jgi:hypothetical protein
MLVAGLSYWFATLPLTAWIIGAAIAVYAIIKATAIKSVLSWLWRKFLPDRPKITIEIREVSLDQKLASLDADFAGFTIDAYLFFDVWVVNKNTTPTTAKLWKLKVVIDGRKSEAEFVGDISKWHHLRKKTEYEHGHTVVRDVRTKMTPFGIDPLQQGLPVNGWVCFLIRGVRPASIQAATVELIMVDSFDRTHRAQAKGPWPSENQTVNPDMPW